MRSISRAGCLAQRTVYPAWVRRRRRAGPAWSSSSARWRDCSRTWRTSTPRSAPSQTLSSSSPRRQPTSRISSQVQTFVSISLFLCIFLNQKSVQSSPACPVSQKFTFWYWLYQTVSHKLNEPKHFSYENFYSAVATITICLFQVWGNGGAWSADVSRSGLSSCRAWRRC